MNASGWHPFDDGRTLQQSGSEGGIILRDEYHCGGARITLERDSTTAPFAITCGIYGWLVHTRYFSSQQAAERAFEDMKRALADVLPRIPAKEDPQIRSKTEEVVRALKQFVHRFP